MKTSNIVIGSLVSLAFLTVGGLWLYGKQPLPQNAISTPAEPTGSWITYHSPNLGYSLQYPNDNTYAVKDFGYGVLPSSTRSGDQPPPVYGYDIGISQSFLTVQRPNSFSIYVTTDSHILSSLPLSLEVSSTQLINGLLFQKLVMDPAASAGAPLHSYAYAIQQNKYYYVFVSGLGPNNPIFEHMMATLVFD